MFLGAGSYLSDTFSLTSESGVKIIMIIFYCAVMHSQTFTVDSIHLGQKMVSFIKNTTIVFPTLAQNVSQTSFNSKTVQGKNKDGR